ncbi:hypothetical protein QR680_005494 [Steinernema hermaphroditum]|uniref:ubiquitinyl hydrolase 1 n=1 Tax=Steinernema hermaphroditum TaxID=289476 RepID=A0AA39LVG1_9BILA|nr:hypothetical protein QR680_005494 [Steinernema hermaphroditum]
MTTGDPPPPKLRFDSLEQLNLVAPLSGDVKKKLLTPKQSLEELLRTVESFVKGVMAERRSGNLENEYTLLFQICELCVLVTRQHPIHSKISKKDSPEGKLFLINKKCLVDLERIEKTLTALYGRRRNSLRADKGPMAVNGKSENGAESASTVRSSTYSITPLDLVRTVSGKKDPKSALVVDFREHKAEIVKFSKESQISVVGIPRSCLENSCIFQVILKSVPLGSRVLLNRLTDFDLIVLLDSGEQPDPFEANGKLTRNSAAGILYAALYDYNNHYRPKVPPLYLKGGFAAWRTTYPAYVARADGSSRRTSLLGDGDIDIVKAIAKLRTSKRVGVCPDLLKPKSRPPSRGPSPVRPPSPPGTSTPGFQPALPQSFSSESVGAFTISDNIPFIENGAPRVQPYGTVKPSTSFPPRPPPTPSFSLRNRVAPLAPSRPDPPVLRQVPAVDRSMKPKSPDANGFGHSPSSETCNGKDVRTLGGARPDVSASPSVSSLASIARSAPALPPPRATVDRMAKEPTEKKEAEFQINVMSVYEACVENLRKKSRKGQAQPGYTGLINIVNTCFMNATLQALSNTGPLRALFCRKNFTRIVNRDSRMGSEGVISAAFTALLDMMWCAEFVAVQPEAFRAVFADHVNEFLANGQQHDAAEFENILIDALHEDTNVVSNPKPVVLPEFTGENIRADAAKYDSISKQFADSPINQIFSLQTVSPKRCSSCKTQTVVFEGMLFIALDLRNDGHHTTLEDCLERYFSLEEVDVECSHCKLRRRMTRHTKMWKLPKVLVIQLKRFGEMGNNYVKKDINVRFGKQLNVKPFLHEKADDSRSVYTLYSVTNHVGNLNSGHYYAHVKNAKTRQWLEFNDESVRPVSEDSLQTKAAFVLYYTNE